MSTAKDAVLDRIRFALRDIPRAELPEAVAVARDYIKVEAAGRSAILDRFHERVADYKAVVRRVSAGELPGAIVEACARRGVARLVVPADLPAEWLPAGIEILSDAPSLSIEQLEGSDGVLTGCALGIAQTGTIVLDAGPRQGRRVLTLLPDYHLCVVEASQVVGMVPEAVTQLRNNALTPSRPQTWISGPSATSDIELNRVEGVHGPRTLEVLIVC